jgi:hypothetical protein
MAHKKRRVGGKRRHGGGRRYDPHAKRRFTTRFGRKYGYERPDLGSERLRAKKLAATGREDVELTPAGILYGHGHLDRHQYDALGHVTELLQCVARAMGRGVTVNGLWLAIVAAGSKAASASLPLAGDLGARRQLDRICRRLDGSRELVLELAQEGPLPPICARAAGRLLTPRDLVQLELLRQGLDGISPPHQWAAEGC